MEHERARSIQSAGKKDLMCNTNCFSEWTINTKSFEYIRAKQKSVSFSFYVQESGRKKKKSLIDIEN